MISSAKHLKTLFSALDEKLTEPLSIYVIGAANLISLGRDRATKDVDAMEPKHYSAGEQLAIMDVGEAHGLEMGWLNSAAQMGVRRLPEDWKTRAKKYFSGKCLTVWMVGRSEMIFLKMVATLSRIEPDYNDLLWMKPKAAELTKAAKRVMQQTDINDAENRVNDLIARLKKDLKRG